MKSISITLIPSLSDNYTPVLRMSDGPGVLVVDPSESAPVLDFLEREGLVARFIFLTHHHGDHIGGVAGLTKKFPHCEVIGFNDDQHRLPPLTAALREGDLIEVFGLIFEVWHMPGHTSGHIIYVCREQKIAFVGDVLFGLGCGRVFEGTYDDMFQTLQRFRHLSGDFRLYCAHEYTEKNAAFALAKCPGNAVIRQRADAVKNLRANGRFTVPLILSEELASNPFLLAGTLGEFSALRDARNVF